MYNMKINDIIMKKKSVGELISNSEAVSLFCSIMYDAIFLSYMILKTKHHSFVSKSVKRLLSAVIALWVTNIDLMLTLLKQFE